MVDLPRTHRKTCCFATQIAKVIHQINDEYFLTTEEYYPVTSDTEELLPNSEPLKHNSRFLVNSTAIFSVFFIVSIIYLIKSIKCSFPIYSNLASSNEVFEFVHITDIHLDSKYVPSSSVKTFCRKFDEKYVQTPYYYGRYWCDSPFALFHSMLRFINTKLYPKRQSKTIQTNPHSKTITKPSFVILGGDLCGHYLQKNMTESHSFITEIVNNISISFHGYPPNYQGHFGNYHPNDIPILIVLGNNEFTPNYGGLNFSFDKQNFALLYENILGPIVLKDKSYSTLQQKDDPSHDAFVQRQKETFTKGGYYFYDFPKMKLRLLIMNTIAYHTSRIEFTRELIESQKNKRNLINNNSTIKSNISNVESNNNTILNKKENMTNGQINSTINNENCVLNNAIIDLDDPYDQFQWVITASKEAHDKLNYSVAIALHMTPGSAHTNGDFKRLSQGWATEYIKKFDEVLSKSQIEFIIAGHSHYDMFFPINGKESQSGQIAVVSPAVSPMHGNNPGFRIFQLSNKGQLIDYKQYYADLLANPRPNIIPFNSRNVSRSSLGLKWKFAYSFQETYRPAFLSEFKKKESPNEIDDNDGDNEDPGDFPLYNASDYNVSVSFTSAIPEFKMNNHAIQTVAINQNSLAKVINWVATTNEGKWIYKARVMNMASEHDHFYKCILFSTTLDQIYECLGPIS